MYINKGYVEDEAFQLVIGSIGDVKQLFADLGADDRYTEWLLSVHSGYSSYAEYPY